MKTAELTPLTVVYAIRRGEHSATYRGVLLSTVPHVAVLDYGFIHPTVALHPDPGGSGYRNNMRSGARGLLVLQESSCHDLAAVRERYSDDRLLSIAQGLPRIDGSYPPVPDGLTVTVMFPQMIRSTWADFVDDQDAATAAQAEHQAQREALVAGERAECQAVLELLKTYDVDRSALGVTNGWHGEGSVRVSDMAWADLHAILLGLIQAVTDEAREQS